MTGPLSPGSSIHYVQSPEACSLSTLALRHGPALLVPSSPPGHLPGVAPALQADPHSDGAPRSKDSDTRRCSFIPGLPSLPRACEQGPQAEGWARVEGRSQQEHLSNTTQSGGRPAALGQEAAPQPGLRRPQQFQQSHSSRASQGLQAPAPAASAVPAHGRETKLPPQQARAALSWRRSSLSHESGDQGLRPPRTGTSPSGRGRKHPVELLLGCTCV